VALYASLSGNITIYTFVIIVSYVIKLVETVIKWHGYITSHVVFC